jgi:signal transduction histidine kinase
MRTRVSRPGGRDLSAPIDLQRLLGASERRRLAAEALAEVGRLLTQSLEVSVVTSRILDNVGQLLRAHSPSLYRLDPASGALVAVAVSSSIAGTIGAGFAFPPGTGMGGLAVRCREAVTSPNLLEDPRVILTPELRRRLEGAPYRALLSVPLMIKEDVIGVLSVGDRAGRIFDDDDIHIGRAFADQAALALHNARLYETAQHALGALQAKNAELDGFAYMVSHDLKAPLVTIQGMASMLVADCGPSLDERGRHYLRRIEANVAQMERLITDVLALSRVGRDARPAALVPLTEVVDEVLAGFGDRIRAAGVKVARHDQGAVWAIRTELEQVVSNLVGNAVKYIGDTADPQIEIGAVERSGWLECYVRDNGIGIEPAYHQQVFEIFQRLKELSVEGTGVGLAIVKKIVEAVGGRVWVESAKGHGSTFFFTWPTGARPR